MVQAITQFKEKFSFLSNFHFCIFEYRGHIYYSSEHAFQSEKSNDAEWKKVCLLENSPGFIKKESRKVKLISGWELKKVVIMKNVLLAKFSLPFLKKKLLDTGESILQEGNSWHDTFWGVDIKTGKGKNMLGKLLMEVREEIRSKKC